MSDVALQLKHQIFERLDAGAPQSVVLAWLAAANQENGVIA